MHGRANDPPQQWSVHAQFTISHPGIDDPNAAPPQTHTERDENGVRMVYTWTSQPGAAPSDSQDTQTTSAPISTSTTTTESTRQPVPSAYGFQRGNLVFTSVPPRRPVGFVEQVTTPSPPKVNVAAPSVQDSGYHSEQLLSPNSLASSGFPRRPMQSYGRRCKSTCSIVLSTTINEQPELEETSESIAQQTQCGRTQSLRCQTPTVRSEPSNSFYGCGDPWCYHSTYGDDGSATFSPVHSSETSTSTAPTVIKRPSRTNSFGSQNLARSVSEVRRFWGPENRSKDAAVQTFEMVDKCTSPFMKVDSFYFKDQETQDNLLRKEKTLKKRSSYNSRSRTEPVFMRTHSPSSFTPDSLESHEPTKRLMRTPAKIYGKSPFLSDRKSSPSDSKSSDPTKKPRTVHIDVYCTGTEQESEGSDSTSDIDSKTASSPQTVFESEKVRITHSRSDDKNLPIKLQEQLSASSSKTDMKSLPDKTWPNIKPGNESDNDDNTSTAYPSQISSYSAIPGLSSFSSSVPPSWSTYSMSVDNDYDSVANTSWKDTFSDIESLNRSRSSIAPTDSLDFVPRRVLSSHKSESIEEHPEAERKSVDTTSIASLNPSDSFEYANSEDRVRIRRMEQMWNKPTPIQQRHWKSPHLERKHLLQQQKLKEYVEKRLSGISLPKSESRDSDSGSDSSEKGWSFVKDDEKKLQRDITVRRASKDGFDQNQKKPYTNKGGKSGRGDLKVSESFANRRSPALRSPSVVAIEARLTLNPGLRAPFMAVPGIFTDQRYIARRFGSVVDVFRKPGHHIGPAKNPECQCDHCRSFYESGGRGRARSVGEVPSTHPWMNWRSTNRLSQPRDIKAELFNDS